MLFIYSFIFVFVFNLFFQKDDRFNAMRAQVLSLTSQLQKVPETIVSLFISLFKNISYFLKTTN